METEQLEQNLDMAIFSQLLEMDHEEDRLTSSIAFYTFIERANNTIDDMEHALDIRQLISSAECLQNAALELGLYRVQESCQNIRRANTTIKEDAEVSNVRREADPIHAEDEIGRLRNSVACARSTIDYFYNYVA
ncbi:hypothetical protein N7516_001603 [Penicillium verrucosum]|uniref:uncharacterized protein n=1 Tax=Penicillium verrucosum TaxID=60171 RepID=UPI0025456E58|nr:uncharacterized protein N7516_001603 [Penicillium verrucosum]KAJ5941435.1 hypothetical protein N7516_001603 [Penicillium verrucosum]